MLPHARTLPVGLLTAMLSGGLGTTDAKAQAVFVASKVQITSTSGTVAATTPEGSKVIVPQTPSASGEAPVSATQRAGSVVETGPDSQATLALPGAGTLLMSADTQVRLPKPGDKGQSLELLRGKLFMNISAEEVKKQGNASFRLKTPAALLAVKGTKFFASVEKDTETCGVHEGQIGTFAAVSRQLNEVQAGNAFSIIKGKPEPIRPLTDDERRETINYELAASEGRITNSLGMKLAAVPGTKVLFCIHETRIRDFMPYAQVAKSRGNDFSYLMKKGYGGFEITQRVEDHPVTAMGLNIVGFCSWLSQKEGRVYRLPTDEEWSFASGIGRLEKRTAGSQSADLDGKLADVYPWGKTWPPPPRAGNFCDESYHRLLRPADPYLKGYDDGFPTTAPVMSFPPNAYGLFDLGGNCWEHVLVDEASVPKMLDPQNGAYPAMVTRGGSFLHSAPEMLSADKRGPTWLGEGDVTFRIVLASFD
jgi:hypothetical protein